MDTFGTIVLLMLSTAMVVVPAIAYFRKKAENDRMEKEMNADKHK